MERSFPRLPETTENAAPARKARALSTAAADLPHTEFAQGFGQPRSASQHMGNSLARRLGDGDRLERHVELAVF